MRLYFPVDLTVNLIMIEKLVLGEIWTGDLPISNTYALTSAPSRLDKTMQDKTIRGRLNFNTILIFLMEQYLMKLWWKTNRDNTDCDIQSQGFQFKRYATISVSGSQWCESIPVWKSDNTRKINKTEHP